MSFLVRCFYIVQRRLWGSIADCQLLSIDRLTEKAPEPKTGPNDVLIDVYSAALNFFGK